jgi:DNA-binding NtrC family response regulator
MNMSAALILVVTNDPGLRSMMRVCLRGNGHQLEMAQNGPAAMSKLNQQQYDVILLDYDRAEIGSTAVLQHLHDHRPSSRVVLMLEHDSPFAAEPPETFGVEACLVKPFDPQAIEQILNSPFPDASMSEPARRAQADPRRRSRSTERRNLSSSREDRSPIGEMASIQKTDHG